MKKHIGELQAQGTQVVLPGSKNTNGEEYKIYKDVPIATLTEEKLNIIKQRYTNNGDTAAVEGRTFIVQSPNWSVYSKTPLCDKLPITSLVDMSKLKSYKDEFFGSHEIHGSTTGMNFFVNPTKNLWHCYRCNGGGDSLSYLAVKEGICQCSDFTPNGKKLRGDDFKRTIKIAKEKYNINFGDTAINESILNPQLNQLKIITDAELSSMEFGETECIVQDLAPKESLVLVVGKTRSMKSFFTTSMGFSACWGKPFLNRFITEQSRWLYIDEENPKRITKFRNSLIRKGLEIPPTEDFGYLLHSGLKLTKESDVLLLKKFIQDFNADVVVLDSLIRFLTNTDENTAMDMSSVFTTLRQISSELNVTFIIIHHMNKTPDRQGIDRVRGSSDIVNAVDVVLLFDRENADSPFIKITMEKNRFDREIGPFIVQLESNNEENSLSFSITNDIVAVNNRYTRAANEIFMWLSNREWENPTIRTFTTSELRDIFEGRFNENAETNRKIIQGALRTLITASKIERVDTGEYRLLVAPAEKSEANEDTNDGGGEDEPATGDD